MRMAISNMKDPMRALMTIREVVSWSGVYYRLSRMKQNLDEGVLNTIIDQKKNTRRACTTTQPESRTTPKVSLNQEEVYRPYKSVPVLALTNTKAKDKMEIPISRVVTRIIKGIARTIGRTIRIIETLRRTIKVMTHRQGTKDLW